MPGIFASGLELASSPLRARTRMRNRRRREGGYSPHLVRSLFSDQSTRAGLRKLRRASASRCRSISPTGRSRLSGTTSATTSPITPTLRTARNCSANWLRLNAAPVYVRVHNLLTSGDGSASLKWGSTNVYSEDASGHPIYSWAILDQIFDTFRAAGVKPLVEIGFMPKALSIHPEPYRHDFPRGRSATFIRDGPIRRRIIRSGRNLFSSLFTISANGTAMPK